MREAPRDWRIPAHRPIKFVYIRDRQFVDAVREQAE
jgi:hypothetical protein